VNDRERTSYAIAGGRCQDRTAWVRVLLHCATAALAAALVASRALAPDAALAQERVTLIGTAHTGLITVTLGKSRDVSTEQGFSDVMVGDPSVADVNPLTDHSLSILGKKIGTTRVTVYDQNKKPVGIFDIDVTYDVSRLAADISRFTGRGIRVSSINGRIILSGTASDAVTLDRAVTIARQFAPDLINAVQVTRPQQVELDVRFIECSRQASRELGVQWNYFGGHTVANIGDQALAGQLPITTAGGAFQNAVPSGTSAAGGLNGATGTTSIASAVAAGVLSGSAPFGFLVSQVSHLQMEINALEQKGLARSLAQPNLVALSGETASFLAGGQFYVPVPQSLGTVTFAPQNYGVGLSFTPTVLKGGLIDLVIKPEVSEIDTSHSVTVAGTTVPGLITRKASTTLELRDGQSFMLGGLLQNSSTTAQDQLPWVGDVPVLGALFRSSEYQKNETDLVILVTPHIVRPLPPTARLHTPLDNTLAANDVDFFLMGKAEISPAQARLILDATNRPHDGHILDLPKHGGVYVSARD
jgi:pilus assembly protein CpaC